MKTLNTSVLDYSIKNEILLRISIESEKIDEQGLNQITEALKLFLNQTMEIKNFIVLEENEEIH